MSFFIFQDEATARHAQRFQLQANLEDVHLLDCASRTEEGFDLGEEELRLALQVDSALMRQEGQQVWIAVMVGITGKRKDSEASAFESHCRFALRYRLRDEYRASEEEIEAFREGNAIFHCWPYSRELLQNLTMRMGLDVPPIPLLRLAPKTAEKTTAATPAARKRRAVPSRGK